MTELHPQQRRPVRSFVLRQGRVTTAQERAFVELWPRYGVEWRPGSVLEPQRLFGSHQPLILEIGFGNGGALLTLAERHPDRNYLGVEVHRPGIGHLLLEIRRRALTNVRVLRADAVELLESGLSSASLEGVYLFFPDPWPKKKHHKRRIFNARFMRLLARALRRGGALQVATDWEPYAQEMLRLLTTDPRFENSAQTGGFSPRPADRPLTKFEQRGRSLGHGVWDLVFRRR
jgi:tRNA (guanine-N7-)-methyltransferase